MQKTLAFLHTSPVHIATFDALVRDMAPGLNLHHHVDAGLLIAAQQSGVADPHVIQRIQSAMQEAAASGADMVVCTCSSIGGVAERMCGASGLQTARIDRAMADRAVTQGPRVLLVAALETTLLPTAELLQESATALNQPLVISNLLVADAWAHFLQGNSDAYRLAIVHAVRQRVQDEAAEIDVIVLAQASMAAAAPDLAELGKEVLSSPRLGVAHVLSLLQVN
ncbi:aspartate/glutamate racemase family protein [Undibacterium sp. JH2W]|uniref:aspartate/glutamate racemase family protein n=1 Tax=Undibacterium sp. JH2W TaxID=3413037 RepID=UPI003BF0980E